jgi:hypothetical protein
LVRSFAKKSFFRGGLNFHIHLKKNLFFIKPIVKILYKVDEKQENPTNLYYKKKLRPRNDRQPPRWDPDRIRTERGNLK